MTRNRTSWIGLAAALCLSLACASAPPGPTGSLKGIAVDDSGNALPGITVTLRSPEGKLVETVVTGPDGSYSFQDMPVGQYQVITTFAGFTTPKPLDATVTADAMTTLPHLVPLSPDTPGGNPSN